MEELIRTRASGYAEYENLLIRRDNLKKESEQFRLAYIREFGELITDVFRKQIECISKKKQIAWCTARANRNEEINAAELESYITAVMKDYKAQLEAMVRDSEAAKNAGSVSSFDLKKIKEIYRYLAKLIHPDRRPDLAGDETIQDLWHRISLAYTYNRLNELEELRFKTEKYLSSLGQEEFEFDIPDLEEKIAKLHDEIDSILTSLPYTYRFILDDENEKEDRRKELEEQLESYTSYARELDEVLSRFNIVRSFS